MKKSFIICLAFLPFLSKAQDTTKVMHNEIGFNTVSLIKQLISNNPSSTLSQSPYLIFYNYYFDRTYGLRLGLGGNVSKVSADVQGQIDPRVTNTSNMDGRAGISVNYVKQNRVTLNAFADFVYSSANMLTVNTTTIQDFPNPVFIEKVETSSKTSGLGFQLGTGVKYNIYRHLSMYIELPISFMVFKTKISDDIYRNGILFEFNSSKSKATDLRINLPTTLYLVLRF